MAKTYKITDTIHKTGINPCIDVPEEIVRKLQTDAGKNSGPVKVVCRCNHHEFRITIVKYSGKWRLYLDGNVLKEARVKVGEQVTVEAYFDPHPPGYIMHPLLKKELGKNPVALKNFNKLAPSYQMSILRYISFLKTDSSVARNVEKVIARLEKGEKVYW